MKKAVLVALVITLFTGVCFAATPSTATGGPVTLTAIIPSYIGFTGPNVQSITFDYTNLGLAVATGVPVTKLASALPSWTLLYNLAGKPTITVCAYATPLQGSSSNVIPTANLFGAPNGSNTAQQFNQSACGQTANAVVMDTIPNATFNTGKAESFTGMFMQTDNGTQISPDTYTGSLTIVAQAQ